MLKSTSGKIEDGGRRQNWSWYDDSDMRKISCAFTFLLFLQHRTKDAITTSF